MLQRTYVVMRRTKHISAQETPSMDVATEGDFVMIRSLAVAAVLLAAPAAFAQSTVAVRVAATDLADVTQMDSLHRDLASAAKRVCAREMADLPRLAYKSCVDDTLARAIAAAGSETLVALDRAVPANQRFASNRPAVLEATVATFK